MKELKEINDAYKCTNPCVKYAFRIILLQSMPFIWYEMFHTLRSKTV